MGTPPEPMTLIAFRFLEPKTPPNPHNAACDPAPCTRQPRRLLVSPAGPQQTTAGIWVLKWFSASSAHSP